jgi:predicted nucleic acid-binding protein
VIVVDASAALSALLNDGPARRALGHDQLHVPHLIDTEVGNGLRRQVAGRIISERDGRAAVVVWKRLGMTRYPAFSLLERVWELRENVTAYDATYVALAEALNCVLLTADARLTRAAGIRCAMTLVPR